MKTSIIPILILIILAGCTSNADQIKVGIMLPQTGLGASLGDQMLKGIDLAANETGYPFELIIEDDQCDAKQGVVAAKKLVEVNQVDAIIGPICTVAILPSIDIIESAKIPRITTGMVVQRVAEAGPYHFSLLPEMKHQMKAMTDYASQKGYKRIAAIAINDDLGKESIAELKQALSEKGIGLVAEEYFDRPETDFRARLTKIDTSSLTI